MCPGEVWLGAGGHGFVERSYGYAAYQTATKPGADGPVSCSLVFYWAHVRREFVEAERVAPVCAEVLSLMGQLYAIDADLPDPHVLPGEQQAAALVQRLAVRQEKSALLVAAIRQWALAQRSLPGSAPRKALEYMLELWRGLTVFLAIIHGSLSMTDLFVSRGFRWDR